MAVAVLIPTYNERSALARTLLGVRAHAPSLGGVTVFLVDDGSAPAVDPAALPPPTPDYGFVLARHALNMGQGAALETARRLALDHAASFEAYVTMDADGQHGVDDALALVDAIRAGADAAFGNRFAGDSNVPPLRRAVLVLARLFENALTGLRLEDAHNGYRAFRREALERLPIHQNRMAHATEIKQRVSRGALRVVEVPVSVRYTPETRAKGQSSLGALPILRDLLHRYLFGGAE